ncbi:hypothetical protein Sjap_019837 [Stephania japonica]|uniref:S5 DRBM domain-containing protein n=1 Tax=Stephania japonica TaxID=461633 RepID=A0AAP0HV37_9MAGN
MSDGVKPVGYKWVFVRKRNEKNEVTRYKARLVAQGFSQRPGIDYEKTYSPVIDAITFRFLISLAVSEGLDMHLMDVVTAYLSLEVDKNPFQPHESEEELIGSEVPYLSAIGALMYLANCTRLNIVFVVNLLARYSSSPTRRHWNGVKHVFWYLRGTSDMGLFYSRGVKLNLQGYADAGFLSDPHKVHSQTGYVFTCGSAPFKNALAQLTIVLGILERNKASAGDAPSPPLALALALALAMAMAASLTTKLRTACSLSRLLATPPLLRNPNPNPNLSSSLTHSPPLPHTQCRAPIPRHRFFSSSGGAAEELLAEVERERQREREEKRRAGVEIDDKDEEDEEDYMGVGPLIEKLEKEKLKPCPDLYLREEPTDSESEDDERFAPDALKKRFEEFEKKFKRHEELLKNFTDAESFDDAFKWMNKIDKFEQKHFHLRPEYRVIGELMNRLKEATGKDRFILLQKLNRATRLVQWKESYDPENPANYGVIQHQQVGPSHDLVENAGFERDKRMLQGEIDEDDEDFIEDKDDILMEKLNAIDKKLEEKLSELDHTFGKKGKVLEEEIKDLAEERSSLTEQKRRPLFRKGFDVKVIDVNRTCKVTKGGRIAKYTAMVACGNYHGVVGYAKGKGPAVPIALQKAYEKCFQNLHYVDRYEEHTIAHAVQTQYEKTKIYLWPAPTRTGMKAGKTVQTILNLVGLKNVKSKVIGSRNPHNTVKALFKALNAIATPKDIQEKFGRTVVESYLLQ